MHCFFLQIYVYFLFITLYLFPLFIMTVSYVIIIIIIWKKSSLDDKTETNDRSRFRRLISLRRAPTNGKTCHNCYFFFTLLTLFFLLVHQQMESSIRNVGSLGVIPRAKIKTVKMTLVIVIG